MSVNNQKMQKVMPVSYGNLIVKNALKPSPKCLEDKICKIKQIKGIPVTLGIFLNQQFLTTWDKIYQI